MMLLCLTILVLLLFILVRKQKKYNEVWKYILKIPGPDSVPLIGTNYKLLPCELLFVRERERMKNFHPIYKSWVLNFPFVHLAGPEDIELILNKTIHNTKGLSHKMMLEDWLGSGLVVSSGLKWHKRRKMLTPAFHFNVLRDFVEVFQIESEALVENFMSLCDQPYIDVEKYINQYSLFSIGGTSLGMCLRENPRSIQYLKTLQDYKAHLSYRIEHPWLFVPFLYKLSPAYKRYQETIKRLHEFTEYIISERTKVYLQDQSRTNTKLPLLDLMLRIKQSTGDIDDEGVKEELDTFIGAAHDTTAMSLCYTLMLLANNQVIQNEIYQEILSVLGDSNPPSYNDVSELKFMERCIKESLRLYPTVPVINRVLGEEVKTKSGYTIPKGCNVLINIFDLHRSSQIWENPETYDPDRFLPENTRTRHPFAYLPFSAGSRNCVGQKFALLEMKVALCGILRKFILEPVDTPQDVMCKNQVTLRPAGGIKIKFVARV